ncbi:MAG: ABC transporter permease [Burkholderiales bacterium]|nr:ABC transporter permease [Burkholderiales bacterium]
MSVFGDALASASAMLAAGDATLAEITLLSLRVSASATLVGALLGLPLGAWAALTRWRGRQAVIVMLNAAMGLPPVVVGLVVYLLLSRSGPLGSLAWLFTPAGMILAQAVLIFPIIAALTRQTIEDVHAPLAEWLTSLGVTTTQRVMTLLYEARFSLAVVMLAGFGRAIAEVGAVMVVGGNIAGSTRVMTTTIALETSKGDLPLALALGMLLLALVLLVSGVAQALKRWLESRYV